MVWHGAVGALHCTLQVCLPRMIKTGLHNDVHFPHDESTRISFPTPINGSVLKGDSCNMISFAGVLNECCFWIELWQMESTFFH
jgi:hypothetical protein